MRICRCLNRLVLENGYTQVVNSPTRGDAFLDVYLVRTKTSFTFCINVQAISDHCGVLLEVEVQEKIRRVISGVTEKTI